MMALLHTIAVALVGIITFCIAVGIVSAVLMWLREIMQVFAALVLFFGFAWGATYGAYTLGSWVVGLFS